MSNSDDLFKRALEAIPGGVNSPVRAYGAVGGVPRFVARARGSTITDVDGNDYVDYVMSWGAAILGHAHEHVVDAVARAARAGSSYGAPTEGELVLAERIADAVPSIERVRLVSSGTEAAMSAIRLARGATGRAKLVKFAGCYHGHSDALLADAGSGVATFAIPGTPGVTAGATQDTLVLPFNDVAAVRAAFGEAGGAIACVIVEPVAANMGVVPPAPGFLDELRAHCDRHGALLIFDEVITGFRLGTGGAQEWFGVRPDLTLLGKVAGGGLPLAAFGGRTDVMEQLAPAGPIYQAGTLSGNPIAVAAALATLDVLRTEPPYARLERMAVAICDAFDGATVNRAGSLFSAFFTDGSVTDLVTARAQDTTRYARFFHAMLDRGIWLAPSGFEAWFVSAAHTDEDVERTVQAIEASLRETL
ncbi:MAG: glutamate-1-semialdehyde 2,1-aminomutase [Actinomycetota bacterium]